MFGDEGDSSMTGPAMWRLEDELCRFSGQARIHDAISRLNLLPNTDEELQIECTRDWYRAGSETYLYKFRLTGTSGTSRQFVLKACVVFSPGSSIDTTIENWVARRALLARAGVCVPTLYAYGYGLVLEEYISMPLKEAWRIGPQSTLLSHLVHIAAMLSLYGFQAIAPFRDVRSRGTDVVYVDFGQDLGPPYRCSAPSHTPFEQLLAQLNAWSIQLGHGDEDVLFEQYLQTSVLRSKLVREAQFQC
jgi:hypothetical protein